MKPNRHPVDQLGDLRAEIKKLKVREQELKAAVEGDRLNTIGEEYHAMWQPRVSDTLSLHRLEESCSAAFTSIIACLDEFPTAQSCRSQSQTEILYIYKRVTGVTKTTRRKRGKGACLRQ